MSQTTINNNDSGATVRAALNTMFAELYAAVGAEAFQDMIATFLVAGAGISLTYDDAGNAMTIASSNPKSNFTTSDPTTSSDSTAGYSVGSSWFNSASGVAWRCLDASAGAAVWYQGGAMSHAGYSSGLYYPAQRSTTAVTTAVVADTLYACPIFIAQRVTLSGLGIRNNTGAASTAVKLGLYNNVAGRPGTLLAAGGSVSTTVSGGDSFSAFGSNYTVPPGIYWIASIFNGAPSPSCMTGDILLSALLGAASMANLNGSASNLISGVTGTGATYSGGFNSSFGTATLATSTAGVPIGHIKIA